MQGRPPALRFFRTRLPVCVRTRTGRHADRREIDGFCPLCPFVPMIHILGVLGCGQSLRWWLNRQILQSRTRRAARRFLTCVSYGTHGQFAKRKKRLLQMLVDSLLRNEGPVKFTQRYRPEVHVEFLFSNLGILWRKFVCLRVSGGCAVSG